MAQYNRLSRMARLPFRGGSGDKSSMDRRCAEPHGQGRAGTRTDTYLHMAHPLNSNRLQSLAVSLRARFRRTGGGLMALPLILLVTGCAVPQPRGTGKLERHVEASSHRGYYLYLPRDYMNADENAKHSRRWPLIVSFHGMKPFDNSLSQAHELESEADRYGMIVLAPDLEAPDVLEQFPVRTVNNGFKSDEDATVQIIDEVLKSTGADSHNVMSTSWSSGGYLAHYMLNRHPERFTCLAVRQSNFSSSVLDADMTQRSRDYPILIVNTEGDFAVCLKESTEAVEWYQNHGYKNCAWVRLRGGGHERTPDLAADFFGRVAGVQQLHPPQAIVQRQAIDGNAAGLALLSGKPAGAPALASADMRASNKETSHPDLLFANAATMNPTPTRNSGNTVPQPKPAAARPLELTPTRDAQLVAANQQQRSKVSIRVSSAIGIEPLSVSFSAECPNDWFNSADFAWTLNGSLIGRGVNGAKTLTEAGDYTLGLAVVTKSGDEFRSARVIRVVPRSAANSPVVSAASN